MDERDPIVDFLVLGCETLIFCEKINNDLPPKDAEIEAEARVLYREILARGRGNRSGSATIGNKDGVVMVERFIRTAYERLKLAE